MSLSSIGIAIALVTGLVQVAKSIGLSSRFAPLAALIFGFGSVYVMSGSVHSAIITGIIVGLTSSGLYSGVKTTATSNVSTPSQSTDTTTG